MLDGHKSKRQWDLRALGQGKVYVPSLGVGWTFAIFVDLAKVK
jgi:hypothetical protein